MSEILNKMYIFIVYDNKTDCDSIDNLVSPMYAKTHQNVLYLNKHMIVCIL